MKPVALFLMLFVLFSCSMKSHLPVVSEINQKWEFRQADSGSWNKATVPGCVHTDLLAIGQIEDPFNRMNEKNLQWIDKKDWEYRTSFKLDKKILARENLQLDFKGLDTYASVYLNDSLILSTDNMFREWTADVKKILHPGDNQLRIRFDSPIRRGLEKNTAWGFDLPAVNDLSQIGEIGNKRVSVFTRKAPYHYGWDWGPRFVTSGIWRPVYLIAWDDARISDLWFRQPQVNEKKASLVATFTIRADREGPAQIAVTNTANMSILVSRDVNLVRGENIFELPFEIDHPDLWWTNGLGKQPLYSLEGSLMIDNQPVDKKLLKTGIRSLKLVQQDDRDGKGKSFYFELNGVPVFMKGANYIPNDAFLTRVTPEKYQSVVERAVKANMNMLRVWGGGIYENDLFYDLCDEKGILLWQDFMFACSMYPGDSLFLSNVREEVLQNVTRLRNHASLALWCGNNEIETAWKNWGWQKEYNEKQKQIIEAGYDSLFLSLIPGIVHRLDPDRSYWPSSPSQRMIAPADQKQTELFSGDVHNWAVWHGKQPFEMYETYIPRFMSEYGFQSFPEKREIQTFTKPEDWSIESPVMNWHQRSAPGNMLIKTYMDMYYRQPKDFDMFLYLNQVVQAEGVGVGMEAHRRSRPWCMGTLYWQLNDCWPAPSWSSTDYDGHWKALQYAAKKDYANFMVSITVMSDSLKVFAVSDSLVDMKATLRLKIFGLDGKILWTRDSETTVKANNSIQIFSSPEKEFLEDFNPEGILFFAELISNNRVLATRTYRFAAQKDLALEKPIIRYTIEPNPDGSFHLLLTTDKPALDVYLNAETCDGLFSDNYFNLLPGQKKEITFSPSGDCTGFAQNLKIISLRDSYE